MCDVQAPEQNSIFRIKSVTESKLQGLKSGFRSDRSTTEQIMALRILKEAAITQMHFLTVALVDHGKALDSANGWSIQVVLRHYGVPDTVVADVMQLYHGSTAAVSTRFGLTETFDTISGVLQGDTLSPPAGRLHSHTITRR